MLLGSEPGRANRETPPRGHRFLGPRLARIKRFLLRYVATLTPISSAASHCSKPRDQRRSRKAAPSVPSGTLMRSYRRIAGLGAEKAR